MRTILPKRLSPQKREAIQKSFNALVAKKGLNKTDAISHLKQRTTKKPLNGMSAKLFTGADVERVLQSAIKDISEKSNKEIEQKTNKLASKFERKIDMMFGQLKEYISLTIEAIPRPQDGKTPTTEDIKVLIDPIKKEFEDKIVSIHEQTLEKETKTLEELNTLKERLTNISNKRVGSGGSGPVNFYDIADVPNKAGKYQPAYAGYEGLFPRVKADGTGLEFDTASGGSSEWLTPTGTVDASNNVFIVLSEPKEVLSDGITYVAGNGYSYNAGEITLDVAPSQYIRYR